MNSVNLIIIKKMHKCPSFHLNGGGVTSGKHPGKCGTFHSPNYVPNVLSPCMPTTALVVLQCCMLRLINMSC